MIALLAVVLIILAFNAGVILAGMLDQSSQQDAFLAGWRSGWQAGRAFEDDTEPRFRTIEQQAIDRLLEETKP